MKKIASSLEELIGNTPMIALNKIMRKHSLKASILAKLEFFNPAGSVKDRIALAMIEEAEQSQKIQPSAVLIEPTSGNTGIGLAAIAAAKSYRLLIVMPDTMSRERQLAMQAFGAELVLTPGALGMKGAIERAEELHASIPNSLVMGQFENPANPAMHFRTTGPEIYNETDGKIDCFVAGVGTGGTITGVGEFLKKKNPNIQIIAVEPSTSPVLSQSRSGTHKIQGIGAGFVPKILNRNIIDEVLTISDEDAFETTRMLAKTEGLLVGISSGAATAAAIQLAQRPENAHKTIVTLLPDSGMRYLSTPVFQIIE